MATYKVLQDIEAEDKLLGPLTLKQFIFAIITIVLIFVAFVLAKTNVLLSIPWIPPIAFFGFMASPIGRDQPNDIWLAARIRFLIKPRRRLWDQSGMTELVTITAPKKVQRQLVDNMNTTEVRSRLGALANTMDSRGWAVKNVAVNISTGQYVTQEASTDRLVTAAELPQEVESIDIHESDDILDPMNNMIAQRFDTAIKQKQVEHIANLKQAVKSGSIPAYKPAAQPAQDYSFITQPAVDPGYTTFGAQVITPGAPVVAQATEPAKPAAPSADESAFLAKRHAEQQQPVNHGHEHVVVPLSEHKPVAPITPPQPQIIPAPLKAPDGILKELGQSGDNLSVAALAHLAKHAEKEASLHDNDVVSLH